MSTQAQNKREILKDKVVSLVKDHLTNEGGITSYDLNVLFGSPSRGIEQNEIATTLAQIPILLSPQS